MRVIFPWQSYLSILKPIFDVRDWLIPTCPRHLSVWHPGDICPKIYVSLFLLHFFHLKKNVHLSRIGNILPISFMGDKKPKRHPHPYLPTGYKVVSPKDKRHDCKSLSQDFFLQNSEFTESNSEIPNTVVFLKKKHQFPLYADGAEPSTWGWRVVSVPLSSAHKPFEMKARPRMRTPPLWGLWKRGKQVGSGFWNLY